MYYYLLSTPRSVAYLDYHRILSWVRYEPAFYEYLSFSFFIDATTSIVTHRTIRTNIHQTPDGKIRPKRNRRVIRFTAMLVEWQVLLRRWRNAWKFPSAAAAALRAPWRLTLWGHAAGSVGLGADRSMAVVPIALFFNVCGCVCCVYWTEGLLFSDKHSATDLQLATLFLTYFGRMSEKADREGGGHSIELIISEARCLFYLAEFDWLLFNVFSVGLDWNCAINSV